MSLIPWEFLKQRPHKFAEELAKRGHSIYYFEPCASLPTRAHILVNAIRSQKAPARVVPGIWRIGPLLVPPFKRYTSLLKHNRWLSLLGARAMRKLNLDFAIVLSTEYLTAVRRAGVRYAFDHIDDTHFMDHICTERFQKDMAVLKQWSAFNIYIQEGAARSDSKGVCITNGVDLKEFFPIARKKVFDGVSLSIMSSWFDIESVLESKKQLLLIGPIDVAGGHNRQALVEAGRPNVLWMPQIDKDVANQWLAAARTGLVVRRADHPAVNYMMPVKIMEYFAAGLPVVTYHNQAIEDLYGDMVTFYGRADGDRTLDEAIDVALGTKHDLRGFASRFQWSDLVSKLDGLIEDAVGKGAGS